MSLDTKLGSLSLSLSSASLALSLECSMSDRLAVLIVYLAKHSHTQPSNICVNS